MNVEKRINEPADCTNLELPSEREILITRSFDAPARIVFEAITNPAHIRRWWAPKSRGEMLSCEVDLRIGGVWRFVMRAKNGMEVGFSGKFLELDAPTRIVQTEVFDPFPDALSVVTVTLGEVGRRTTLSSRVLYPSKEVRDQVLASGMERGMRESYRQLTDAVDALARG
ncbi:MAG TPA: SRPBCC family protein [Polyangiaceae bacterium]|nr:SRPBCC family protein [Polyangiaceae bacterium]